jgi:hypothetical protein
MAGLLFTFASGAKALVAATAQTTLQITAPANQRLKLLHATVAFDGTNAAAVPVNIQIVRQTTAGTFSATLSAGRVNTGTSDETAQAVGKTTSTAEPTYSDVLEDFNITPNAGTLIYDLPFSQEHQVPGGGRVGIVLTAPAIVNARTTLKYEE